MAEKFPPTEEQQKVIDTTDRTVLLSAAAGSGKTKTLTDRLIRMITREKDPLDVTRMLVATFTRAAAEELRTRIADALKKAAAERPEDKRLSKQLLLLPTARIRTIDAFCNDLVKGHTETLGISPFYRIADEAELDLVAITILDDLIEEAYSGTYAPHGLDIATLVEIAENVKEGGTLAESLYVLYKDHLHSLKEGVARLKADADTLRREATLPFFETRAGRALARHYKDTALYVRDYAEAACKDFLPYLDKGNSIGVALFNRVTYLQAFSLQLADACDVSLDALKATVSDMAYPKLSGKKGYVYSDEETRVRDRADHAKKILVEKIAEELQWTDSELSLVFEESARVTESLYLLLKEFEDRLNAEKRRRSIFDYSDIASFAHTLLRDENNEPTPLALELRNSLDAVCIDEYQDVNELQADLFNVIAKDDNLFMVGDIKQSIYAFRGAVPDIFARLRKSPPPETAKKSHTVLYLTQNFRSEEPIISFANGIFDFLFPIIGDSIGYVDEDRLFTQKKKGAVSVPTLYMLEKESTAGKPKSEEAEEQSKRTEDDLIAEKIELLLEKGYLANGKKITPGDIAVLGRKYPYSVVDALKARNIPIRTRDKTDFFARREILLALCLLHAINNPHREIYLAGLLRSPLYGFTLDDLTRLHAAHKDGTLFDALCAFPDKEKTGRVLSDLARFRRMARDLPAHRLIRTAFRETGIYAATDAAGRANLRILYELARTFEGTSFRGLYRFLDHVTEMTAHGKGMPERDTGSDDAVTVSTMHTSKGLEYPVCIIADTGNTLLQREKHVFPFTEELGVVSHILYSDGKALLSTPLLAAHNVVRKKREIEEEIRVLYVALTRPRERLYLYCTPSGPKLTDTLLAEAEHLRLAPTPSALFEYATYGAWILAALKNKSDIYRQVNVKAPYNPLEESEPPPPTRDEAQKEGAEDMRRKKHRTNLSLASFHKGETARVLKKLPKLTREEQKDAYQRIYTKRFAFVYGHENETRLPAKLSVSTLYPGVLDELTARSPFESVSMEKSEEPAPTEFTPTLPTFLSGKEENEAAKAGTATHLFLQFCDFDRILTTKGSHYDIIVEELDRLCERGFLTLEDAKRVRCHELARFLSSDLRDALVTAKELKREFRFHAMLPAENFSLSEDGAFRDLSVFAQGVIDLLIVRADGSLLLVDYKTDRLPKDVSDADASALLFSRHGTQLSVYASAVEKIFGKTPTVAIYSLPKGKLLTMADKT